MSSEPGPAKKTELRNEEDATGPVLARVLAGEPQAFEEIVRLHEAYVYHTCLGITHNAEDAEEAMQDAFFKTYRNLHNFRRESKFRTWLTRIAVNEALQRLRRRQRAESLDELVETDESLVPRQLEAWHPDPEELYSSEEMGKIVEEAIWALPAAYRVVFVLRDVCELNTAETAEILNLSIAAVKSRLLRARLMVRERLAQRLPRPQRRGALARTSSMIRILAERFCRALGI